MTKTAYPSPEVLKVLAAAQAKKVSERINELIAKGIAKEQEERMRADYERYATELSGTPARKNKRGITAPMAMAVGLFTSEHEPKDWF